MTQRRRAGEEEDASWTGEQVSSKEDVGMQRSMTTTIGFVGLSLLFWACKADESGPLPGVEVEASPVVSRTEESPAELEQALVAIERGGDIAKSVATLEALVKNPSTSTDDRDEALLGVSLGAEKLGDKERAISAIEELMMAHSDDARYAASDAAEKRLRKLLSGHEDPGIELPTPQETPTPVAHALAKYFKQDATGFTMIDIAAFGPLAGENREGLHNIRQAKSDQILESCSVCEVNVGQSITSSGSWVSIPKTKAERAADMPQMDRSLLLFYFDLGRNRVPARYDEYLAMPSAEVVARLEAGKGVIAIRERRGGKPTIVIAAPRAGQLPLVAKAFAKLEELPKEVMEVELPSKLQPDEIRAVMRSSRGEQRKCYEALLARDPKAEGKLTLRFEIDPAGATQGAELESAGTTLTDRTVGECILDATRKLRFPSTGEKVSVTYPLLFTPN